MPFLGTNYIMLDVIVKSKVSVEASGVSKRLLEEDIFRILNKLGPEAD